MYPLKDRREQSTWHGHLGHPDDTADCPDGCTCNPDQHSDGIDDLEMKFRQPEFLTVLGLLGDEVATVELTGVLEDGTPFCARDCVTIVSPLGGTNINTLATEDETLMEMAPFDENFDDDGYTDLTRRYPHGTIVSVTAPLISNGRRFIRWSANGILQPLGLRTIEYVASGKESATIKAFYKRPSHPIPDLPTEDDGPLE